MTNLPEETWTPHPLACDCEVCQRDRDMPISRGELAAESSAITTSTMRHMAKMAETMRDQITYLHKTHTVALMAERRFTQGEAINNADAAQQAIELYCEVEERLRGESIPPAA